MRVHVESTLPCDAEDAWSEVQTSRLLEEVASPIVTFRPAKGDDAIPAKWENLETAVVRPRLFGVIPWGTRSMTFERVDSRRRTIQTREHDALVARWDHRIQVRPLADGRCQYTDEIEINAGLLTPLVWLFAQCFYRHRQRRWQDVARRLSAAAGDSMVALMGHA